jgi:hypothetical protein
MIPPKARRSRRGYGNAPFALLFHPVHGGCAFVDFAHFMLPARIKQDPFSGRSLPGVDVRSDTYVSYIF